MGLTVYALKTCDTCRKALKEMAAAGLEPQVVDVRDEGVPGDVLADLIKDPGPETLVNRRSTTWRGLDEDERARAMDPATAASVLGQHPTLMKRPVITGGASTQIGWSAAVKAAVIG